MMFCTSCLFEIEGREKMVGGNPLCARCYTAIKELLKSEGLKLDNAKGKVSLPEVEGKSDDEKTEMYTRAYNGVMRRLGGDANARTA